MSIVVAMGVAGGLGTLVGPILSTGALLYLSDKLRVIGEGYSTLLFGVVLLFVVVAVPWFRRRVRARQSQVTESRVPVSVEEIEAVAGPGSGAKA
jgi:ABC-type branched-subunit amino acid transport system permease subunit